MWRLKLPFEFLSSVLGGVLSDDGLDGCDVLRLVHAVSTVVHHDHLNLVPVLNALQLLQILLQLPRPATLPRLSGGQKGTDLGDGSFCRRRGDNVAPPPPLVPHQRNSARSSTVALRSHWHRTLGRGEQDSLTCVWWVDGV